MKDKNPQNKMLGRSDKYSKQGSSASWRDSDKKKKEKLAVALSYEGKEMQAPEVSLVGKEIIAREILKISRRYNIPVKRTPELANKLSSIAPETPIPEELYDEVAEVFLSLNKKTNEK